MSANCPLAELSLSSDPLVDAQAEMFSALGDDRQAALLSRRRMCRSYLMKRVSDSSSPSAPPPAPGGGAEQLGVVSFEVEGIFKSFGSSPVLRDVSVQFHAGEVHALVGENGAGKSTLAKIMAGVLSHDRGVLRIDGVDHVLLTAGEAQRLGVTMIFQEPTLFPDLSVAENIFVERQPRRPGRPWLDRGAMLARTRELLDAVGSSIPAGRLVRGLSVAEMQMVESRRRCPTTRGS